MAKKRTPTPEQGNPHYILSEDAERQLWRVQHLLRTLADLALASAPKRTVELSAEDLSTTLFLACDLLNLPLTYVPTRKEV